LGPTTAIDGGQIWECVYLFAQGKVEVGALLPRVRIDVTHQGSQFVKGGVLPGVDLQLVGGHVAKGVFLNRVVATSGAEHAEKQRAGLKRG